MPRVLTPGVDRVAWRITLPDGSCVPKPDEQTVENDLEQRTSKRRIRLECPGQ